MCRGVGLPSSEKLVNPWERIRAYLLLNMPPNTLPNALNRLPNDLLNILLNTLPNILLDSLTERYSLFFSILRGENPQNPPILIKRICLFVKSLKKYTGGTPRNNPPQGDLVFFFRFSGGDPLKTPFPPGSLRELLPEGLSFFFPFFFPLV